MYRVSEPIKSFVFNSKRVTCSCLTLHPARLANPHPTLLSGTLSKILRNSGPLMPVTA